MNDFEAVWMAIPKLNFFRILNHFIRNMHILAIIIIFTKFCLPDCILYYLIIYCT